MTEPVTANRTLPPSPLARLVTGMVLLNLLVICLAAGALYQTRSRAELQARESAASVAVMLGKSISGTLDLLDLGLLDIADQVVSQRNEGKPDSLQPLLDKTVKRIPKLDSVGISDAHGMVSLRNGAILKQPVSITDRDYFRRLRDNPDAGLVISTPLIGKVSKKPVVTCARRITLPDGSFGGIAYGVLTLKHFNDLFHTAKLGSNGSVSLRNTDMVLFSRVGPTGSEDNQRTVGTSTISDSWRSLLDAGRTDRGSYTAVSIQDRIRRSYSYQRIEPYNLYVNVGLAVDDYLAGWRYELAGILLLLVLFLLVSVITARHLYVNWQHTRSSFLQLQELESIRRDQQESRDLYLTLMEHSRDKILFLRTDGRIMYANKAAIEDYGYSKVELCSMHVADLRTPDTRQLLSGQLEASSKGGVQFETVHQRKDGTLVEVEISSKGVAIGDRRYLVSIIRNISERKLAEAELQQLQARLLQNEKLASIGQLAAGIAHEINNPIGFISSNFEALVSYVNKFDRYIALLEELLQSDDPERVGQAAAARKQLKLDYVLNDIHNLLHENSDGIERVKKIVQDLKTFVRSDVAAITPTDLNQCLESTITMVWNQIKYVAELKREFGELPRLNCNPQLLNQVFMNLLVNAVHAVAALGQEQPGLITVRSWADQANCYVLISDSGCGIAADQLGKVFDPFFTTKEVGKGTGLGLSISYEIVKKHGGEITVESEVGRGTAFTVRLPMESQKETP